MGQTIPYSEPSLGATNSKIQPFPMPVFPAPGAAWRRGDFLQQITTGSITTPAPTGSMSTTAGPLAANVTLSTTTTSGAPAATYYIIVTYTATSNESLLSQEFIVNCLVGTTPTISVASSGAPAAATDFAAYVSLYSGGEALQQASKTTTALGATYTVAYPLTNSIGANRSVTNPSGSIWGLAQSNSNDVFFSGIGGSSTVNDASLFGASLGPPLVPAEVQQLYVIALGGQPVQINLSQAYAWTYSLVGTTVGLTLDTTSGFFYADPAAGNKVATITGNVSGVLMGANYPGGPGDFGARVIIQMTTSDLVTP